MFKNRMFMNNKEKNFLLFLCIDIDNKSKFLIKYVL